jgi:hypothetical protein
VAGQLERAAQQGDWSAFEPLYAALEREIDRVNAAMRRFLKAGNRTSS